MDAPGVLVSLPDELERLDNTSKVGAAARRWYGHESDRWLVF